MPGLVFRDLKKKSRGESGGEASKRPLLQPQRFIGAFKAGIRDRILHALDHSILLSYVPLTIGHGSDFPQGKYNDGKTRSDFVYVPLTQD